MKVKREKFYVQSRDAQISAEAFLPEKSSMSKAVLIITGITMNRHGIFEKYAIEFAKEGIPSVTFDLRSHNESSGEFRFKFLKQDINNIMTECTNRFKLKSFCLAGFSYGGMLAINASRSGNVCGVVCINTYHDYNALLEASSLSFNTKLLNSAARILSKIHMMNLIPVISDNYSLGRLDQGKGYHGSMNLLFTEMMHSKTTLPIKPDKQTILLYSKDDKFISPSMVEEMTNKLPKKAVALKNIESDHFFSDKISLIIEKTSWILQRNGK